MNCYHGQPECISILSGAAFSALPWPLTESLKTVKNPTNIFWNAFEMKMKRRFLCVYPSLLGQGVEVSGGRMCSTQTSLSRESAIRIVVQSHNGLLKIL